MRDQSLVLAAPEAVLHALNLQKQLKDLALLLLLNGVLSPTLQSDLLIGQGQ